MSIIDFKSKKVDTVKARKMIAEIVHQRRENVLFTSHALQELSNDNLTTVDAWNVLMSKDAKIKTAGEFESGSYRYRLETNFIMLVIVFWPDGRGLKVITAWDKRSRGRR